MWGLFTPHLCYQRGPVLGPADISDKLHLTPTGTRIWAWELISFQSSLLKVWATFIFGEANRGGLSAPQPPPHAALPLQSSRGTPQSVSPRGISTFLVTVIQCNCNWQPNTFGTDLCFNQIFMVKLSFLLIFFKSSLCFCYFPVIQW